MDDQLARCKVAEEEGWGLVLQDKMALSKSIQEILLLDGLKQTNQSNGSSTLASVLSD